MTPIRDLDALLADWLQDGISPAPSGPIDEAIAHARRSPRRPDPFAILRGDVMGRPRLVFGLRLAAVAAVLALIMAGLALAVAGGFFNANRLSLLTPPASPTIPPATPTVRPTVRPTTTVPPSPTPTALPPSPTPCPVIVPQSLQGTWSVVITGTEQTSGRGAPPGTWLMTFTPCEVGIEPVGQPPLPQVVPTITPTQLTLPPDPNCAYQTGVPSKGVYRYRVTSTTLTFTEVSDSCPGRAITISAHPWQRQ